MIKDVRVGVDVSLYDLEGTWENFREWVESIHKQVPEEHRARFRTMYRDGFLEAYYTRSETPQEQQNRERLEADRELKREADERARYEKLKAKFEPLREKFEPQK